MKHISPKTKDYLFIFIITFIASATAMLLIRYIDRISTQDQDVLRGWPSSEGPARKAGQVLAFGQRPDAGEWKVYRNEPYGFEFHYPEQFGDLEVTSESFRTKRENYGTISGTILPMRLDPKRIEGMYGRVESPQAVKVGSQMGYQFLEGDGSCGALVTQTALDENTLQLAFSFCEGDDGPVLYNETPLIHTILSKFKRTKTNE